MPNHSGRQSWTHCNHIEVKSKHVSNPNMKKICRLEYVSEAVVRARHRKKKVVAVVEEEEDNILYLVVITIKEEGKKGG